MATRREFLRSTALASAGLAFSGVSATTLTGCATQGRHSEDSPYYFNGSISREVLENYLNRSVTAGYFATPGMPERYLFPFRLDDIRMVKNIGAKFIGRAIYRWSEESFLADPKFLGSAKLLIDHMHDFDPEMIFQACLFESVTADVNNLAIPAWVFEAFDLPVERRNFSADAMTRRLDPNFVFTQRFRVPLVNNLETRLWFYFLAVSYINIGIEAFHLGQVGLISADDPGMVHYSALLEKIRGYAKTNARRNYIILDAHTPTGGMVKDGVSLLDFNSFPLRIKEVLDSTTMEGILEVGYSDSIYLRSLPAISPSGWVAEDGMPYLIEFDNFGLGANPGVADLASHHTWGYDDITWFARRDEAERNEWLWYAFDWIKETDPNGHLQMPLIRMISGPLGADSFRSYFANTRSVACPVGFSQENTIKEIWDKRLKV
jgi:hypothetical protein